MRQFGGPLRECSNCGRTFNETVTDRCPACRTEIQTEREL